MKPSTALLAVAAAALLAGTPILVRAQAAAAPAATVAPAKLPADPWPRAISISSAAVLVYQPQVNKWQDNQIDFRAALAIKPTGAKEETFGVVFATVFADDSELGAPSIASPRIIRRHDSADAGGVEAGAADDAVAQPEHQTGRAAGNHPGRTRNLRSHGCPH